MIYLDHAATSFPKPPGVAEAMAAFLATAAGNPGRSGHALSRAAHTTVEATRRRLAGLIGAADPARVVFTLNATDAVNLALHGLLQPGDRVVSTGMEHNAVARPLTALAARGVDVVWTRCGPDGTLDLADLERALTAAPTRLVAMVHASNVCGSVLPIAGAAELAHRHGALILVDAAQTAGVLPLDVGALGLDLVAVAGHKSLGGPTGTGALYVAPEVALTPVRQGGTGAHSEDLEPPVDLPGAFEAGTLNTVGLAGLGAALTALEEAGVETIRAREAALTRRLVAGLAELPKVTLHGPGPDQDRVGVVSVTLAGWDPVDAGAALDAAFGIAVRPGLHCAPLAHRTLGTFPRGTIRLSLGATTTEDDIDQAIDALRQLTA
jgi:cysteine desulfurase family protein